MVRKHAKQHEMEVTLSEFFEMFEDQTRGGRAWFVTKACVLIPNIRFAELKRGWRPNELNASCQHHLP